VSVKSYALLIGNLDKPPSLILYNDNNKLRPIPSFLYNKAW